jgi:hypothetical protein
MRTTKPTGGQRRERSSFLIECLESRRMFASIVVNVPAGDSLVFSAPDGTLCNLQFAGCAGTVTFTGDNLEQGSALNGTIVVKGDTTTVQSISVTNSTAASSVTLRSHNPQLIPLGSFTSTGPLKGVTLKGMSLTGGLDAPGIALLNLGAMQNSNVQFAGYTGAQPFTFVCGNVTDTIINSQEPFKSVTFGNFLSTTPGTATTGGTSIFTAPALTTFKINGNMTGDLNLLGGGYPTYTLGKAMITGDVTAGHWTVNGNTFYEGAHSFGNNWSTVQVGTVWNIKTTTDLSGDLTLGSVTSASIGRNMLNANVHFTYPFSPKSYNFKSWSIGNTMQLSTLYGPGNFGSFKSQFVDNSSILAGVGNTFSFNGANQFVSPDAVFDSANIHCHTAMITFADSYIAAPTFGTLNLGMAQTPNGGIPFGVRVDKLIKQLKVNFKNKQVNINNVVNATSVQSALTAAGISAQDAQDFVVNFGS